MQFEDFVQYTSVRSTDWGCWGALDRPDLLVVHSTTQILGKLMILPQRAYARRKTVELLLTIASILILSTNG